MQRTVTVALRRCLQERMSGASPLSARAAPRGMAIDDKRRNRTRVVVEPAGGTQQGPQYTGNIRRVWWLFDEPGVCCVITVGNEGLGVGGFCLIFLILFFGL